MERGGERHRVVEKGIEKWREAKRSGEGRSEVERGVERLIEG